MPLNPPIGVANSVSVNFNYDPMDTVEYALQSEFDLLQVYLNSQLLDNLPLLRQVEAQADHFQQIYYHAEGVLNADFPESEYCKKFYEFVETTRTPNIIIHFDESENIDKLVRAAEILRKRPVTLYLENFFQLSGKINAEKNLKKYQALFTLTRTFGVTLLPVLDIPRFFHEELEYEESEALEWSYQVINFFANRRIPILLHLVDARTADQSRSSFTAIGDGYLPYPKILNFIRKTRPLIAGIILEFEDKINPLTSRDYLRKAFTI